MYSHVISENAHGIGDTLLWECLWMQCFENVCHERWCIGHRSEPDEGMIFDRTGANTSWFRLSLGVVCSGCQCVIIDLGLIASVSVWSHRGVLQQIGGTRKGQVRKEKFGKSQVSVVVALLLVPAHNSALVSSHGADKEGRADQIIYVVVRKWNSHRHEGWR
jgi:hypothetical protein